MTVNEDILLQILDRDPGAIYIALQEQQCNMEALAVLLTYGTKLPAGKEYGEVREHRAQWLACERAKRIRQNIAKLVPDQIKTPQDLQEFIFHVRARRGVGRLISGIIKTCEEKFK